MQRIYPSYYQKFQCIAGACPDSCCHEWEVQVDPDSAERYRTMTGPLGDALREYLYEEEGETYLRNVHDRCPMWRKDGLCRIQAEHGHDALCQVCQQFPRLRHEYGDFEELGLEMSCPEAARLILSDTEGAMCRETVPGGEEPEYDPLDMEILHRSRETARRILSDASRSVNESLALLLMYGYQAQAELNGADASPFDAETLLENARNFARPGDMEPILEFFKNLEILTPEWKARLDAPSPAVWEPRHLTLARYFADRYWLQAISDFDLVGRVKLTLVSCLLVKTLGGDLIQTAQLYSKEIENSIENVVAILDGVYENRAFTDDRLLGLLLL